MTGQLDRQVDRGDDQALFDVVMTYTSTDPAAAVVSPEGRDGSLVGNGDGIVTGALLRGTIEWSFYAADCVWPRVRDGANVAPGRHVCRTSPGGIIRAVDGATISFEGRGFGERGADPARPELWHMVMVVRYRTTSPEYAWLEGQPSLWRGVFDEKRARARYAASALPFHSDALRFS